MDFFINTIESYWQHISIISGLILVYLGYKIAFDRKFLDKLMGEGRMWEYKKNRLFTENAERNYNRGRGVQMLLVGIIFVVFGISSL